MQSHHKDILVTEERRVRPILSKSLIWVSLFTHPLQNKDHPSSREELTFLYQPNEKHIATVDMLENKDFLFS